MFAAVTEAIEAHKGWLSDLDGAIGDGDHGTTMALGFRAVERALSDKGHLPPSDLFREGAQAFLNAVGASTGPLYATGLRRAAQRLDAVSGFGAPEQVLMLEGIAAGVAERGKAQRGDKTMLDVWLPVAETARAALERGEQIWPVSVAKAEERAAATSSMLALRGRAARLGERSLGHRDPGAASAVLILRAMAETLAHRLEV
ncbi:dihydroxyacetone kinase subunit DhaL [Aureimonas psammosilenae]|uniref:dihydroxyacetone kinase subunit DhaL n=1 Tax=Aureimonas psammosilenae TaxID=2495496 RepID=UPI001F421D0E|nr:dihydroxyacetone kinase subunit DhaL [Aureimonas psammosilenae]